MMGTATNVFTFARKGSACGECPRHQACAWRTLGPGEEDSAPAVSVRLHHRGDAVFHAGDRLDALYMLRSGAVKTTISSEDGDEQIVAFHVAGDILGLDAIAGGSYVSTAAVLDTSSVCVLSYDAFRAAMKNAPDASRVLLDAMSSTIRRYEQNLLMLGKLNAEQRMAAFILEQLEAGRRRGLSGAALTLPMSRADIAAYLSLAAETVSRVLTRLQAAGVLVVDRNRVEVLDPERLREAAGRGASPGEPSQGASNAIH